MARSALARCRLGWYSVCQCVFAFRFIIIMVNDCVCGGCTNSSLSGHRVHRFPNKEKKGAIFRAWVRFVLVKRRDFTSASASKNVVVCSVHFRLWVAQTNRLVDFSALHDALSLTSTSCWSYRGRNRIINPHLRSVSKRTFIL